MIIVGIMTLNGESQRRKNDANSTHASDSSILIEASEIDSVYYEQESLSMDTEDKEHFDLIVSKLSELTSWTGVSDTLTMDTLKYYLRFGEPNKINVVRGATHFEFYYDSELNSRGAYFVLAKEGKDTVNRFYFKDDRIMKWINVRLKEVSPNHSLFHYNEITLNNRSNDLLTILNNYKSNKANPHYQERTRVIDELVAKLEKVKTHPDTIKSVNTPEDGGYFEININYLDTLNNIIKQVMINGGEHGGSQYKKYLHHKKIICEIEESNSWVGSDDWYIDTYTYYHQGKVFRSIIKKRETHGFPDTELRIDYSFVNRIEDN